MFIKYNNLDLFNRAFNELDSWFVPYSDKGGPQANIVEKENGHEIRLMVPGFSKENIKISLKNSKIKISGETDGSEEKSIYKEYSLSKFERTFSVPSSVSIDEITAKCENGILTVHVPLPNKLLSKESEITIN